MIHIHLGAMGGTIYLLFIVCHPNHGTSCVRLHPTVAMPCVCPCTGHPPRFTPRLLPLKPRDLVHDTPPYRSNSVQVPTNAD